MLMASRLITFLCQDEFNYCIKITEIGAFASRHFNNYIY